MAKFHQAQMQCILSVQWPLELFAAILVNVWNRTKSVSEVSQKRLFTLLHQEYEAIYIHKPRKMYKSEQVNKLWQAEHSWNTPGGLWSHMENGDVPGGVPPQVPTWGSGA